MKKRFACVLIAILLAFSILTGLVSFADESINDDLYTIDGYRLVSIESLTEDLATIEAHHISTETEKDTPSLRTLPSSCDNSSIMPLPDTNGQGSQGSCTAWAVTYAAMSREEKVKWGWSNYSTEHKFSPAFVFNSLTDNGEGIHISTAMRFIVSNGACSLTIMGYNAGSIAAPNTLQQTVASHFKAGSWNTITGVTDVKEQLLDGKGVVFAFKVPTTFSSSSPIIYGNETLKNSAHSVCIVGYDDNQYGGAFKFLNSWGSSWGQNGYGWITYNAFNMTSVNNYGAGVGYILNYGTDYSVRTNMGDVNNDGDVTAADARLINRYSASLETYTDEQFVRADVDGNGIITAGDARFVLRYSASLETEFPYFV